MGPRVVNVLFGLWLFVSAFLWEHGTSQFYNALIVGTVAVTAALAGLRSGSSWGRHVNAALGGWLLISALLMEGTRSATFWNHIFVGLGLAFYGLAPSFASIRQRTPVHP